jgi:hypothetical protein
MLFIGRLLMKKFTASTFAKFFPAYAIGSVAAFWLVERIVGYWG